MASFLLQVAYTPEAWANMIANPHEPARHSFTSGMVSLVGAWTIAPFLTGWRTC